MMAFLVAVAFVAAVAVTVALGEIDRIAQEHDEETT